MNLEDKLRRLGRADEASFDATSAFDAKVTARVARRRQKRRRLQIVAVTGVAVTALIAIAVSSGSNRSGEVVTVVEPTVGPFSPTVPAPTPTSTRPAPTDPPTVDLTDIAAGESTVPAVPQTLVDGASIVGLNGLEPVSAGSPPAAAAHTSPVQSSHAAPCTFAALSAAAGVPSASLSNLTCEAGWASVTQAPTTVRFFHDTGGAWRLEYTVTLQGSTNTTTTCPPPGIPAGMLAGLIPPKCLTTTSNPPTTGTGPTTTTLVTTVPSSTTSPGTTRATSTSTTSTPTGPAPTT